MRKNFLRSGTTTSPRRHVRLEWTGKTLNIERLPGVTNPVYFAGQEIERVQLRLGEHFVIGQTTFTLVDELAGFDAGLNPMVTERTYTLQNIRHHRFLDPGARLEIISKLPEHIAKSTSDREIYELLVRTLFEGIPSAETAALCSLEGTEVKFLYWDRTGTGSLEVNRELITRAIESGETIVHTWEDENATATEEDETHESAERSSWAFVTPCQENEIHNWALYVAGVSASGRSELDDKLKFAEIVSSTIASFVEVRKLQQRQSALGQFFSSPVIAAISDENPDEVLAPREVEVSVLFCDLRGFSLATERSAGDLLGLLQRVSDALGVLTRYILQEGGVIGDFHGDAAMGFWGWPLAQEDAPVRACKAALAIRTAFEQFSQQANHSLSDFRIGVGVATGKAVAGKIGTVDQVKVTAFGPAVNIAARLETMTKQLNTEILIDSNTANLLANHKSFRTRRLAKVLPYGLEKPIDVCELMPPTDAFPTLSDGDIRNYENALDQFVAGQWQKAWESLHEVPAADRSKDFLISYIASRNRVAPSNWDGVIQLESK